MNEMNINTMNDHDDYQLYKLWIMIPLSQRANVIMVRSGDIARTRNVQISNTIDDEDATQLDP